MNTKSRFMRVLSLLLCLVMLIGMFPTSVFAYGGSSGGTGVPAPGQGGAWGFVYKTATFTRYTLVRLKTNDSWTQSSPDSSFGTYWGTSDGGNNYGCSYSVIGSVDIASSDGLGRTSMKTPSGGVISGSGAAVHQQALSVNRVNWYNTNAMGYAQQGAQFLYDVYSPTQNPVDWANPDISPEYISSHANSILNCTDDILWADNHFLTTDELAAYANNVAKLDTDGIVGEVARDTFGPRYADTVSPDDAKHADYAFYNANEDYSWYKDTSMGGSADNLFFRTFYQGDSKFVNSEGYTYSSVDGTDISDGIGYAGKSLFNAILKYLYNQTLMRETSTYFDGAWDLKYWQDQCAATGENPLNAILYAFYEANRDDCERNGLENGDGVVYKLLIEPGMIYIHNNSLYYAFTTRDLMAYYMNPNGSYRLNSLKESIAMYCRMIAGALTPNAPELGWCSISEIDEANHVIKVRRDDPGSSENPFGRTAVTMPSVTGNSILWSHVENGIFDANEGYGLGILGGIGFAIDRPTANAGLTVNKKVVGNEADMTVTWDFDVKLTASGSLGSAKFYYQTNKTEKSDITSQISSGTYKMTGIPANGWGKIIIEDAPEDVTFIFEVSEPNVVDGKTKYPSDAKHDGYTVTIPAASSGATKTEATGKVVGSFESGKGASLTYQNQKGDLTTGGEAHLIIDYNLPTGATATDGVTSDVITAATEVECGKYAVNQTVTLTPYVNGDVLTDGYEVTLGTGSTPGGETVSAVASYNGIYDSPAGGTKLGTGSFDYTIGHEDLTVLYAQWDVQLRAGGGSGGTGDGGELYNIFFDRNYIGGGITSALAGKSTLKSTLSLSVSTDGGSASDKTESSHEFTVKFGYPKDPVRTGWYFVGWAEDYNALYSEYAMPGESGRDAAARLKAMLPNGGIPKDIKDTNTWYAVWLPGEIRWNANGGELPDPPASNEDYRWTRLSKDRIVAQGIVKADPEWVVSILPVEPTRTGYTFNGWYFNPICTVPIAEESEGLIPNREYYAGWTAEKVYVNYYDTREGKSLVTTQTYNYGDKLTLPKDINDTQGWMFSGWDSADSITLNENVLTYHEGTHGTGDMSDAGYWTLDINAQWNQREANYTATLVWNDYRNNDGCRPVEVTLGLVSSVKNREVATKTVTVDNIADFQTVDFTTDNNGNPLEITTGDASVEHITYSVYLKSYKDIDGDVYTIQDTDASSGMIEVAPISNYDSTVAASYTYALNTINQGSDKAYTGVLYFDHNLITTGDDLKFTIKWDDESNNDGKRPSTVRLTLYANGVPVQDYGFHHSGTGVADVFPGAECCSVSPDGNTWSYTFKDYQKYDDGVFIKYTVELSDYNEDEYEIVGTNPFDVGIMLRHITERIDKTATIIWDDHQNRDGTRPENVDIDLYALQWNTATSRWEKVYVTTATMTGGSTVNSWSQVFENLPKYHGGQKVIYSVEVSSDLNAHIKPGENGYSAVTNEMKITISHNRNLKSLPVTIEWDDHHNNDMIRPKTVIVQLYADGVKMPSANHRAFISGDETADTWTYTFNNLPVYRDGAEGEEIVYTISVEEAVQNSVYGTFITMANGEEEEVVRYTASYMGADGKTTEDISDSAYPYVKLAHDTQQGTITLYAAWHDSSNRDGKRPTSVQVELYQQVDGAQTWIKPLTLVAGRDNSWTYQVTGLPLFENGKAVTYFAEISDDTRTMLLDSCGYTVSPQGNVINLYYTPEIGDITGQISWQDSDNNDAQRPDAVSATLYANGKSTGLTLELNAENDWTAVWHDVDTYYNNNGKLGTLVQYDIRIDVPEGYAVEYTPETVTVADDQIIYINLAHKSDVKDIPVTVYWSDNSNRDGNRPGAVEIQLYANGEKVVGKAMTLSGDEDIWAGIFSDMPIYANGKPIDYTAAPNDDVVGSYTALSAGTTIYLSRDTAVADMRVSFSFRDDSNADGVRPEYLYLTLTANGEEVNEADYVRTVYFEADGTCNLEFSALPVYAHTGSKISYNVVVELDPLAGSTDYTVTTTKDIALSEKNSNVNQVVVTLTRASDLCTKTGHVYWFDANNQRGNRPSSLEISVWKDSSTARVGKYVINSLTNEVTDLSGNVVGSVEVREWGVNNDASCWTYTIENLPKNAVYEGVSTGIYYYASAVDAGLSPWYKVIDGKGNGLNISLTHQNYVDDVVSSKQDFSIEVDWLDNDDAWGYRPNTAGIDITLYANGENYKTVHLNRANVNESNSNAWAYTFKDLPTYLKGNAVVWSAEVQDISKYAETVTNTSGYAVVKMTQSIGFDFTIRWDDSKDDDAVRPGAVTLDIYADGAKVDSITLTGYDDRWEGSITDLPVWREVGTGTPVAYSFSWNDATRSVLTDSYYSASATNHGKEVEANSFYYLSAAEWGNRDDLGLNDLTGQYRFETTLHRNKELIPHFWAEILFDDDADRDGIRPESIKVQLLKNGEPFGAPVEAVIDSTESSWTVSWENLDRYEGGDEITYTALLADTPDGYTKDINASGTKITLTHTPETVDVTGVVNWDDSTELRYVYNSHGQFLYEYPQISRTDVYVQLLKNSEPFGEPLFIDKSGYGTGEKLAGYAAYTWKDLLKYEAQGQEIEYTFRVYSDELDDLLNDGHSLTYNFDTQYLPKAAVSHDLYDVRGTAYYLYDTSDNFLLKNAPVTAYLYNAETRVYTSVSNTVTDENGQFEFLNLPQGLLVIRATYQNGNYVFAGSTGVKLDRHDNEVKILVNRDAQADSDLYRYSASGNAYYQTDKTDNTTKIPVPADSIVLLYKSVNGEADVEYVGMTTTDSTGHYQFDGLASGSYFVNVVFNYNGATYTYDNSDAVKDQLCFIVSGMDITWPDIVKQVNATVDPGPEPGPEPVDPPEPPDDPIPCVVSGDVFFSNHGIHTTDPVAGVDVYIYSAENNTELAKTVTDENGHWTVDALGAADYIAVFSYQGNASRVLLFTIAEDDYTNGKYTAATQYFDKNAKTPTSTITGVVLDENGKRVSAMVKVLGEDGTLVDFAYTDKTGFYEFTVPSGFTYEVQILKVSADTTAFTVGDPDDAYTTLNYYTVSGNFSIDGAAQAGATVAVYQQNDDLGFDLLTATLTDNNGDFTVKLQDSSNYQVVMYRNGNVYDTHRISVGYQDWEPTVTEYNGKYVISGEEDFDSLVLYDTTTNVVRTVKEQDAGNRYSITVPAGSYDLKLTKGDIEKHYYLDAPNTVFTVKHFITVSGSVLDNDGNAALGAVVSLYDENGKQVGTDTIITDGKYSYGVLPEGVYEVRVSKVTGADMMANKTTRDYDSYGNAYPNGMTESSVWSWNINAVSVSGIVTDQTGNAIAAAEVVLRDSNDPNRAYATMTDANGNWTIGVPNGSYIPDAMFEFDIDHIYHSNAADKLDVSGNSMCDVELVIQRYDLTGTIVRDGDDQTIKNADITVAYPDGTVVWTGRSDKNGKFVVTLYPDNYVVTADYRDTTGETAITVRKNCDVTVKLGVSMTLSGTVYDVDGVTPVADGIVYYDGAKSGKVYTDESGHYEISVMVSEIGYYTVYAEASGNTSSRLSAYVGTDTVLDLTLSKNDHNAKYTLSGITTDNEGNRLSNALVTLIYGDDKTKTVSTSTNSKGEYRFDVSDGTYYITAVYEAGNGYVYATNAETTAHINGASVNDKNLVIRLSYELSILVLDADGGSVANATVNYGGAASGTVTTDADGKAIVMLPGGLYDLQAMIGNRTSPSKALNLARSTDVVLTVGGLGLADEKPAVEAHDMTIDGNVIASNGTPVENAKVTLSKWDAAAEEWVEVKSEYSDKDGYYRFTGLAEGTYKVDVEYTLTDIVETDANTFGITGVALDGGNNPYVDATVNLYNADSLLIATVYTDDTGYYAFLNLEYGNYKVEIIPAGDDEKPIIFDKDSTAGNTVIEGTVLDVSGRPVEGATVIVTAADDNSWAHITDATGAYHFELPADGEYEVSITYPCTTIIPTDSYRPDDDDLNAPNLSADSFSISGVVKDTDGNIVEGATVILKDADGNELKHTESAFDGTYAFMDLTPGNYTVEVVWNGNHKTYDVDTDDVKQPDKPDPEDPDVNKVILAGVVTTDHKTPLANTAVAIRNLDTNEIMTITTDADGRFGEVELAKGRYEVIATYHHSHGKNSSDPLTLTVSDKNLALVIILSYIADINGDGKDEQVFAGQDDVFDTPDDFYQAEVGGKTVDVVSGTDGIPGTTDDRYEYDVDGDGTPDKVYVGEDTIPGTEDDWYPYDVDGDGSNEKVFIGKDATPGTDDDWYWSDPDDDGKDEQVFVGDDNAPGTDDDWYLDNDGEKTPVGAMLILKANGGSVGGKSVQKVLLKDFRSLPGATQSGHQFDGWFTSSIGGQRMTDSDVRMLTKTTTLFAHWTKEQTGDHTDGGGGGSRPAAKPSEDSFTVTFNVDGGSYIPTQTVKDGDFAVKPKSPLKPGYEFVGWYLNGKEFDFTRTPIEQDITLTAKWKQTGVKGLLNTDDHIAYISGYPDGMVKPANDITRAEVAMIFYRLLRDDVREEYDATHFDFTDVNENAWYAKAISTLTNLDIITGYSDGTFRPNNAITRAEFATICSRVDALSAGNKTFTDVTAAHWAYRYIASAADKGWISGYPDGSFKPDSNITRAEAMTLVNRVLDRSNLTLDSFTADMKVWPDNADTNSWFYKAVQEATNAHDYKRVEKIEVWTKIDQSPVLGG